LKKKSNATVQDLSSGHNDSSKAVNPRNLIVEEQPNAENQSGFLFINRLGLPCSFMVEGQDLAHMQNHLVEGLLKTKKKESKAEASLEDL